VGRIGKTYPGDVVETNKLPTRFGVDMGKGMAEILEE